MKRQTWYDTNQDILFIVGAYIFTVAATLLIPSSLLRTLTGTVSLCFAPGYLLLAALYPEKDTIGPVQRFTASIGLSIVISGLLGLIITYFVGTDLISTVSMLAIWIAGMAVIASIRRRQSPTVERFSLRQIVSLRAGERKRDASKAMTIVKLVALAILVYAAARLSIISRQIKPQFTEFYILGQDGLAGGYTETVDANTPLKITVGLVNHGIPTQYQIFYSTDDAEYESLAEPLLNNDEKWESELLIPLPASPRYKKITVALHKPGEPFPYRELYLWAYVE